MCHCALSYFSFGRIFVIVEMVLNVVEVTPGNPFQFAAPEFGVRVEDPPEDLGVEETFSPNLASLLAEIMNRTAANQQMEETPELPPAMVSLASTLLTPDSIGTRPRISAAVYGCDSLFQQRSSFIASNNLETVIVGSIVVDISLRRNGSVLNILRPPNSNVVIQNFTKSMASCTLRSEQYCQSIIYPLALPSFFPCSLLKIIMEATQNVSFGT